MKVVVMLTPTKELVDFFCNTNKHNEGILPSKPIQMRLDQVIDLLSNNLLFYLILESLVFLAL
jgi:hypothetical protein